MALAGESGSWPYTVVTCCWCGVGFALHDDTYKFRLNDHGWFYCPNGHQQHFTSKTPDEHRIETLQRDLVAARSDADRARRAREWAERRAKGANIKAGKAKAQQARILRRIAAGVCPHCHRTFKQLAAHMQAKHGKSSRKG